MVVHILRLSALVYSSVAGFLVFSHRRPPRRRRRRPPCPVCCRSGLFCLLSAALCALPLLADCAFAFLALCAPPSLRLSRSDARFTAPFPPPRFPCWLIPLCRLFSIFRVFLVRLASPSLPPRGCLVDTHTLRGIPQVAGACTASWMENPTCLECLGLAVPPPRPPDLQHRTCSQPSPSV